MKGQMKFKMDKECEDILILFRHMKSINIIHPYENLKQTHN